MQNFSTQEIELGDKGKQLFETFFEFNHEEKLHNYMNGVGKNLLYPTPWENLPFSFQIIQSLDINAFAVPGGHVYVTSGMLSFLQTENQLAAVLAHELGHIISGHALKRYKRIDETIELARKLSDQIGTEVAKQVTATFSAAIIRGYRREQELEADNFSSKMINRTNYPNDAVLKTLTSLNNMENAIRTISDTENDEKSTHSIFSSHPAFEQRIELAAQNCKKYGNKKRVITTDTPDNYLKKIDGMIIKNYSDVSLILSLVKLDQSNDISRLLKSEQTPELLMNYIMLLNQLTSWDQLSYPATVKWVTAKPR